MNYDLRNILFCKLSPNFNKKIVDWSNEIIKNKELDSYISLQQFNFMYQYKLEQQNSSLFIPQAIEKDTYDLSTYTNGSVIFHPMYIIRKIYKKNDEKRISNFWIKNNSLFLSVFLVFTNNPKLTTSDVEKLIKKEFKTNMLFDYLTYRSIDLCDFVVVLKTDNLDISMSFANYLQNANWVNNISITYNIKYTSSNLIPASCMNELKKDNIFNTQITISGLRKNEIKLWASESPNMIFNHICLNSNGNYTILNSNKFTTYDLIKLLYDYYDHTNSLYLFAKDINVSICKPCDKIAYKNKNDYALTNLCMKILEKFQNSIQNYNLSWKKPLSELVNMITIMSQNPTQQNICYLLIDSVSLLSNWLQLSCDSEKSLFEYNESILLYVRAWKQLTEEIFEAEPLYSEKIDFLPKTYNFSLSMIEYYTAYSNLISTYLMRIDCYPDLPKENDNFACLTIPKLCRRFKTLPILPDDNPPKDSILYIELPYTAISNPFQIMTSILHEASHLLTDKLRNREYRKQCFLQCVSFEVALNMGIAEMETFSLIYQWVKIGLERLNCNLDYLKHLKAVVYRLFLDYLYVPENIGKLMETYFACYPEMQIVQKHEIYKQVYERRTQLINGTNSNSFSLNNILDDLTLLFSECYADMVMVYTLSLSVLDYISVFESEFKYLDFDNFDIDVNIQVLMQRILIVVLATQTNMNIEFSNTYIKNHSGKVMFFYGKLQKAYDSFNCQSNFKKVNNYWYSKITLNTIISYISRCYSDFKRNNSDEMETLYNKIKSTFISMVHNNEIFNDAFYETIAENRSEVLKKVKNNIFST